MPHISFKPCNRDISLTSSFPIGVWIRGVLSLLSQLAYQVPVDEAVALKAGHGRTDLQSHVEDDLILLCQFFTIANELQEAACREVHNTVHVYMYIGAPHVTKSPAPFILMVREAVTPSFVLHSASRACQVAQLVEH